MSNKIPMLKLETLGLRRQLNKPKVDGILEYILYWCSFGPDDHRKGGIHLSSITKISIWIRKDYYAMAHRTKSLLEHVPCMLRTSHRGLVRVLSLLYVGVKFRKQSCRDTMNQWRDKEPMQTGRCDLLTHRYVRRQERSIRRSTYELDTDDGCRALVSFLASDSKFGTNKLKYPIHSLVVFNSDNKAIPVAWIIAPRCASGDTLRWMRALYNRVHMKDPKWKLAGFIVDDPSATSCNQGAVSVLCIDMLLAGSCMA
ncbi:hypothetical protein HAX54_029655 [Datura stramonium]|uniref:Uncharacterized protein n=1 Tax=Datura stramonium TaxID=4076 RepID=A0ABS8SAD4_DATST|nr:hypothetical protein [Datura stramonium]